MPRRQRRIAGHVLSALLTIAACTWLWQELHALDGAHFAASLRALPATAVAAALALTIASHLLYAGFDLLGRERTQMPLSRGRTLAIAWVSHAFSLALGPLGIALRFRLYLRHHIGTLMAARVWAVTLAANWLGFAAVAAAVLVIDAPRWPRAASWGPGPSRALGVVLACGLVALLWFCARRSQGTAAAWPRWPFVLLQTGLSALNWLLIAGVVRALLPDSVGFAQVLAAVLANALALAVVDVPAGIGVTEAVFVALLEGPVGLAPLIAALAAYRVLYFFVPLVLALGVHLVWEIRRPVSRK